MTAAPYSTRTYTVRRAVHHGVLVDRDDGARFRVTRPAGATTATVERLVHDRHSGELLRYPVHAWDAEHAAVLLASRTATGGAS